MNIKELKEHVLIAIDELKNHGKFPKENNLYDYKMELNFFGIVDTIEIFTRNFAKDILSFGNSNGGIILLGIKEDKGILEDLGLDLKNLQLLDELDLNDVSQKFQKISKCNVDIDLQAFQSGTRKFYYLLIAKQNQVVIPINDFPEYKLKKGDIIYRTSSTNKIANETTQDFNHFLQVKSSEKNKEFMEIWSKLLPEMFEINPREVLLINPKENKVYGYNGKENSLSSSEIDVDKSETGVFNIILRAISAGEIGKISDTEGKPLYRIVGQVKSLAQRESISITTLLSEVNRESKYKISSVQLKCVIRQLNWVDDSKFKVDNPVKNPINDTYHKYTWLETVDTIKGTHKVVFSADAVNEIVKIVDDKNLHTIIFERNLELKKESQIQ